MFCTGKQFEVSRFRITVSHFKKKIVDSQLKPKRSVDERHLGLVPFLRLLNVFGGQVLVLQADVPQSGRQVGFGHLHVHLHVLLLMHLVLHLQHFLQVDTFMLSASSADVIKNLKKIKKSLLDIFSR